MVDTTKDATPFDTANIPGPKMAKAVNPKVMGKLISRAKRPLLIVGMEILTDDLIDRAIEIGSKGIPIAATAHSIKGFREKDYNRSVKSIGLHELTNDLRDPEWKGLDGGGNYDLVIFLGITYYFASQMMAALKNFAPHLKTISIDRYYHPNAGMTFGNLSKADLLEALKEVIEEL